MNKIYLDFDHFVKMYSVLGEYFNAAQSTPAMTLVYKALINHCPYITNEMFSYAVEKSLLRCKFLPKISDLLEELFERDRSGLPKAPDIDPRFADSYQMSQYNNWKNNCDKALLTAPLSNTHFRQDRIAEIPNLLPLPESKLSINNYECDDVVNLSNCRLCPSLTFKQKQSIFSSGDMKLIAGR